LAGPLTAASMAVISWSSVAVEGQAGTAAVCWGSWAWRAEARRAAARARKSVERRMLGFYRMGEELFLFGGEGCCESLGFKGEAWVTGYKRPQKL
jgi:hypothetical protein